VQRKDEDKQMIGHRLQVAVEGMEGMRSEGSWNCEEGFREGLEDVRKGHTEPFVVGLVNILVNRGMV